jgi:hypothetical protein
MTVIEGKAVNPVRGYLLFLAGIEVSAPEAVISVSVEIIDISVLHGGEEIVPLQEGGNHVAVCGVHGVNVVIVIDT